MTQRTHYLFINTSGRTVAIYAPEEPSPIDWKTLNTDHQRYSEKVRELLVAHGLQAADIRGVVVMQGKGSFSDTRAGVLVANLMLENLDVPAVSIKAGEGDESWPAAIARLAKTPLQPDYYAEPNITRAK